MAVTDLHPSDRDVLLVVDMQNDFVPGGALGVPRGDQILPAINRLIRRFAHVVLTQDWHPLGHISFASNLPGKHPGEDVTLAYGRQVLWPDHCVQATHGAHFVDDLDIAKGELILRKGFNPEIDSYSAFFENDRKTATGLGGYRRERGLTRVFMAGLALDFCVRYSADDARKLGFEVVVVEDACAAIDLAGSAAVARALFSDVGVNVACELSIACPH